MGFNSIRPLVSCNSRTNFAARNELQLQAFPVEIVPPNGDLRVMIFLPLENLSPKSTSHCKRSVPISLS